MWNVRVLLVAALLTLALGDDEGSEYTGDSVYQLTVETEQQFQYLRTLQEQGFDFWTRVHFGNVDVRINAKDWTSVKQGLQDLNIEFTTMILDLDSLLEESRSWMSNGNKSRTADYSLNWFEEYHSTEEIQGYMQYLENNYNYTSIKSIGKSYQQRDMQVLQVCKGGCGNKPALWIDGGMHAREWITPAAVTYWMNELVVNNDNHPQLTEKLDWYFLPVMNPDGYEYSWEEGQIEGSSTAKRLWRKTMSGWSEGITECWGVDANRNWGFEWNQGSDPCRIDYPGVEAFSEIENKNVRDFVLERKENIKFFNNVHSYSQLVLLPWGYKDQEPDNYTAMFELAQMAADKMEAVHQQKYTVGRAPELLYVAKGVSLDWALAVAGIPYNMAMELRPGTRQGWQGFLLPSEQIIPTGEETWAFNMAIAEHIIDEFGEKTTTSVTTSSSTTTTSVTTTSLSTTTSASSTSDCCATKTVGTNVYLFKEKSIETGNFNCEDACVYQLEGTDRRFCFAPGTFEVECIRD